MIFRRRLICVFVCLFAFGNTLVADQLRPGTYSVTQTWSQETRFKRNYHVMIPDRRPKMPVLIILHGNGGDAKRFLAGFAHRNRLLASRYILVAPEGYLKSWNIVAERSKADDLQFVETIVQRLLKFDNVQTNDISILGSSNGAALANQIAIESKIPNLRNFITIVSQLNSPQHNGKNFRHKGKNNDYTQIAKPPKGRRILNISGTHDRLIPYEGGRSRVIPGKKGKLSFVAAERSTYLWAKQMGYEGPPLKKPTSTQGNLETFQYLNGDVVHYKVIGAGHNAGGAVNDKILLRFLENETRGPKRR